MWKLPKSCISFKRCGDNLWIDIGRNGGIELETDGMVLCENLYYPLITLCQYLVYQKEPNRIRKHGA